MGGRAGPENRTPPRKGPRPTPTPAVPLNQIPNPTSNAVSVAEKAGAGRTFSNFSGFPVSPVFKRFRKKNHSFFGRWPGLHLTFHTQHTRGRERPPPVAPPGPHPGSSGLAEDGGEATLSPSFREAVPFPRHTRKRRLHAEVTRLTVREPADRSWTVVSPATRPGRPPRSSEKGDRDFVSFQK